MNYDEEHIRAVLAFIRPHQNVIDYELEDFRSPAREALRRLQATIDEAFGRRSQAAKTLRVNAFPTTPTLESRRT